MWFDGIDSGVNSIYVSDLYPRKGQRVTLSLKVPENPEIRTVLLVTFLKEGLDERECRHVADRYEADVSVSSEMYWYFVLVTDGAFWYYSEKGLSAGVPVFRDCFFLRPDLDLATWAASSTCYQIFPDRFCRGDASLGAQEGAYSFDGGVVSVHAFTEKPLPFSQGRCLDFFNGDLPGIEAKLDYLKEHGFDTLYLNPIGCSCTTHRYDCIDYYHVDPKLGGDKAFSRLLASAHEKGMRIIVDISINHTGTNHPWFRKALENPHAKEHSYYCFGEDGKPVCWAGVPTLVQLNYGCGELRDALYRKPESVMRTFLKPPFGQDGWRLDVAPQVGRTERDDYCHEVWREVRDSLKQDKDGVYLVGEDWGDASSHLAGDEWDATMNYLGCSRPLRSWMGESDHYLSDGWGTNPRPTRPFRGEELEKTMTDALLSVPSQLRFLQFNLIDSHDIPRLSVHGRDDFSVYSGCVMLQYLLPGMPSTYYGDEVGLDGPYGSLEDCRYPMQWDERKWDQRFVGLYKELAETRKEYRDVLSFGAWRFIARGPESVAFSRYDGNRAVVAVLNRNAKPFDFVLDNQVLGMNKAREAGKVSFAAESMTVHLEAKENLLLHLSRDL